jgi:anaerobic nitric oxide reductase transcription regulator
LIHRESRRNRKPMVELNCAALPENLAESELFGHVRGAFSGAHQDRAGRFELAHQGTLFLDEVGELPLAMQGTLLRALQSGQIQRVGSDRTHRVDVRIIAATNRDLRAEEAAGRFRADLYHRISGFPIKVPPLRERGEDISLLAGYFLERSQRKLGVRLVRIEQESSRWLRNYGWPGNVRELEHALDRAVLLAISEGQRADGMIRIFPRHLGSHACTPTAIATAPEEVENMPFSDAVDTFKRQLLRHRIELHGGNLAAASRSLGLDRGNLHRQLKRLGIR